MFAAMLASAAFAKHDGAYLNKITQDYVTPHYKFQTNSELKPLRVYFIMGRAGGRDAVEVKQRMPMQSEHTLTYNRAVFAAENMYESTIEGTSVYERNNEIAEKLNKEYDLYVIGTFDFTKMPESAQFRILNAVMQGKGLVLVQAGGPQRLPYRKLYQNPIEVPTFFKDFAQPSSNVKIQAYQVGKGKLVSIGYNSRFAVDRSLLPVIPYDNKWKAQHENSAAFFAMLCRYAANCEIKPAADVTRIRDIWNKDVTNVKNLPAGKYYKDEIAADGTFKVTEFVKESPFGKMTVNLPETADKKAPFSGKISVEKAQTSDTDILLELYDSPYSRIWHRQVVKLPANAKEVDFTLKDYFMPTLAGYVRATAFNSKKEALDIVDNLLFFPDPSLDDYMQLGWDGPTGPSGELLSPQTVGRLGWNLQLNHPTANGANARDMALLDQKLVAYMVRVMIRKGKEGGVIQPNWFFLPSKLRAEQKALNGDENIYRPEVRKLWAAGIAERMKNLPKYSTAIYNLGDENELELEAGYGPSDLIYFREFLKNKYKDIANLNYNYKSNYKSFDEVPHTPLKEAKDNGLYPAWLDHRAYMEKMYADHHAWLRQEIRKHAPNAVVGAEGSVPGDIELTMKELEYWGPYSSTVGDELLRSFGNEKIRMLWWGGYPGSHSGRAKYVQPLNKDLLVGSVNGNAWFAANPGSNHSSFGCDFTIAQYVKNYLPELDRLKDGAAHLMIRNPIVNNGVYIYWSHNSSAAALLDPCCISPSDGVIPLIRAGYRTGYGFDFISWRTPERLKKAKTVFLCGASALSDKECADLLNFVCNGGTLIADINPAIMNENLRVRESNPLAPLFGNILFKDCHGQSPAQYKPLALNSGFKAARVPVYGEKLFVEKKYGKGKAILCNFSLASASNTALDSGISFDQWILKLLESGNAAPDFNVISKISADTMIRFRKNKDFTLAGIMVPIKDMTQPVIVKLKKDSYIYEIGKGFIGKKRQLEARFNNSPLALYSIFDREQSAPVFAVGNTVRGKLLDFKLPVLTSGRIYRLELFNPAGEKVYTCIFDRAEKAPRRPIAYTESTGIWSAKLTDVATNLNKTVKFEVK